MTSIRGERLAVEVLAEYPIAFAKGELPQGARFEGFSISNESTRRGRDAVAGDAQDASKNGVWITLHDHHVADNRGLGVEHQHDVALEGVGGHGVSSHLGQADDHVVETDEDEGGGHEELWPAFASPSPRRITDDETVRHGVQSISAAGT